MTLVKYLLSHLFDPLQEQVGTLPDEFESVAEYKCYLKSFLIPETVAQLTRIPDPRTIYQDEKSLYFKANETSIKPMDVFVVSKSGLMPTSMKDQFQIFVVDRITEKTTNPKDSHANSKTAEELKEYYISFQMNATCEVLDVEVPKVDILYLGNIATNVRIEKAINSSEFAPILKDYLQAPFPPRKLGYLDSKSKLIELLPELNQLLSF
jgi:hypothetical protein